MRKTRFTVTEDHIKLARNIVFDWNNSEELTTTWKAYDGWKHVK